MADLTIGGVYFNEDLDATFGGNITAATVLNINRAAGSTNDRLTITSADIVTTIERVESTVDAAAGYGRIDFKTNAATGGTAGRGGFKFIDGDGDNILYLENNDSSATFAGAVSVNSKFIIANNGTATWGGAADYGNLTWDTGYALIYGQSGKGIKLGTNGSTLALTLDTSQNATFAGNIVLDDASGAAPQVQWINGSDDTGAMYLTSGGKLQIVTGGSVRQEISSGSTEFTGACMPSADSTYDLGTTGNRWSTLFVDNITITNDLPGGPYLPLAGGTLTSTLNINGNGAAALKWGNTGNLATLTYNGSSNPIIRAESGKSLIFDTNGATTALTIDTSQNATFAGALTTAGIITVNGGTENLLGSFVSTDSIAEIRIQDDTAYTRLLNVGSQFKIMPNDGSETLILDGSDDSATFAGDVLLSSSKGVYTNVVQAVSSAGLKLGNDNNSGYVFVKDSGEVCIGTESPSSNSNYGTGDLNVENNVFAAAQIMSHNSTAGNYSFLGIGKSSGTGASPTIVQAEETVGAIRYYGYDGNDYRTLAAISADVDGTPGDDDMPGRLEFFTTADGAYNPTKRLTISSTGGATFTGSITSGAIYAPIYYDSSNSGYYLDPAGPSNLNSATFAGQLTTAASAASAPGYSFSSDTNTGMYSNATGYLMFAADGTQGMQMTDTVLEMKVPIQLDTSVSAGASSGTIIKAGTHMSALVAGNLYYAANSMGSLQWAGTDADSGTKNMIALSLGTDADVDGMLLNGIYHKASHSFTVGLPIYISTDPSAMTNTAPSGSGDYVRVVGYAIDSNHIYFCPDNTWVEIS